MATERLTYTFIDVRSTVATPAGDLVDVLLVPEGFVEADSRDRDFEFDRATGEMIIEQFVRRGRAMAIDYDHESVGPEYRAANTIARAAGWIEAMFYRDGQGLYGQVKWTDQARELIRTDQMRYLSPAIWRNKKTGKVTGMHSAALTVNPAIVGGLPVTATRTTRERKDDTMPDEMAGAMTADPGVLIGEIKSLLDISDIPDEGDTTSVLKAIRDALKSKPSKPDAEADSGDGEEMAANVRQALSLKPDASKDAVLVALNTLRKSRADADALSEKVKALEERQAQRDARDLVQPYIDCHKINPEDTEDMKVCLSLARSDPEAFKHQMKHRRVYAQPGEWEAPARDEASPDANEEKIIADAVQANSGNKGDALISLQSRMIREQVDRGLNRKAAIEVCRKNYPKIFATS